MWLRAYDTVHVSSVQPENIRPGQEFEINDAAGEVLLKAHPGLFAVVGAHTEAKAEPAPQNKAELPPENKSEPAAEGAPEPMSRRSVPRR